jgi:uncharacterized protein (DUF362 family)
VENNPIRETLDRRGFLARLVRGSAMAMGAGILGATFWDRKPPRPAEAGLAGKLLPDYSPAGKGHRLAVAHGPERGRNIEAVVSALGGMANFVRPGDRVLIKVNAAFATPPLLGATSHPAAVSALVKLCLGAGAASVRVTDNPINDAASCFALSGIEAAARSAGAGVILPAAEGFEPYTVPDARLIRNWPVFLSPLRRAERVIGLCPVKDHHRSGASMTLKNWYGLLGGRRNIFHQQIHRIIFELAMMIRPTLVILDGTQSMVSNGPTGGSLEDLKPTRTVIAGTDPVAVDSMGAGLLGKTPDQLPHLLMAQRAGLGTTDFRTLAPVEVNAERRG